MKTLKIISRGIVGLIGCLILFAVIVLTIKVAVTIADYIWTLW